MNPAAPIDVNATSGEVASVTPADIEAKIFDLLAKRQDGATLCPSDVARALLPEHDRWRALMPQVRAVAQDLANHHRLSVTRHGVPVAATSPGGPIRLGRAATFRHTDS